MKKHRESHWSLSILSASASLCNFFLPIFMCRRLAPAEIGNFKIFFLYLGVLPVLCLGTGFVNGTYFWGANTLDGREKNLAGFQVSMLLSFLAVAIVALASFMETAVTYPWLFAFSIPPLVAGGIYEASLVANGRTQKAAWFNLSFETLRALAMFAALYASYSLQLILLAHVVSSWLKLFAGAIGLFRFEDLRAPSKKIVSEILAYALPVSVASIFVLLVQNADRYLLAFLLSKSEFALYSFGCLTIPPAQALEQSAFQVLISRLAGIKESSEAAIRLYREAIEELSFLLVPLSALLIACAQPLINVLFTEKYSEGAIYLTLYAPFYALMAFPPDVYARATGSSSWILKTSIWTGLLSTALTGLGAALFHTKGALIGFLLGHGIRRWNGTWHYAKTCKIPFRKLIPAKEFCLISLASLLAAFAGRIAALQAPSQLLGLLGGIGGFLPAYLIFLFLLSPKSVLRIFVRIKMAFEKKTGFLS